MAFGWCAEATSAIAVSVLVTLTSRKLAKRFYGHRRPRREATITEMPGYESCESPCRPVSDESLNIRMRGPFFGEMMGLTEYIVEVRDKGEVTIPKELRKKYALTPKRSVRLIPKVEGILIKPRPEDPVSELKGLAREVWPSDRSSVEIVGEIRRRADFEAKEKL
jgi:bifunctional DNA-binding transcriptional regulator/antitoxin component of YhaV-PrlF toxin-antitoxin module